MVAIALVQSAAVSLRYVHFSIAGESVVTALRERLYASVLEQDIAFFDERRTGDLTNRLASDTSVLQSALSANISMGLRNAASVLGGLGFLFCTSPVLTALMLLVVPAVAIGAVYYGATCAGCPRPFRTPWPSRTRWRRRASPVSAPCAASPPRRGSLPDTARRCGIPSRWPSRACAPERAS